MACAGGRCDGYNIVMHLCHDGIVVFLYNSHKTLEAVVLICFRLFRIFILLF